jgi:hypothetical protein
MFLAAVFTEAADAPGALRQVLVMTESADDKPLNDSFELWDTFCRLKPSPGGANPHCSITAVTISWFQGRSHMFAWRHDAESLVEVQPGIFRVQFNGRLSPCSGLDVIIRMDQSLLKIADVKGTMWSGTQCQSVNVFALDTRSESRAIPPIWNPSYRPTR